MRAFHFVNEKFGLEDIKKRRLKIAIINELNDPFEFLGVTLSTKQRRYAFKKTKDQLATIRGLLCFSRDWHNPVQWSHYADRHRGLCLGFDIPDEQLLHVKYLQKRLSIDIEQLAVSREEDIHAMEEILSTKYSHWRYEKEVRLFVPLKKRDPEKGLYFADFSEDLKLAQVIVGAESSLSKATAQAALGDLASSVDLVKARLAFRSFRIVRQRNQDLWA